MQKNTYDIAIIGAGAAGLNLAHAMLRDVYFDDKKILIIEKDRKDQNDRTWCFWEKGEGRWDHLLRQSWESGAFYANSIQQPLKLLPYRYKMLRAIDFYDSVKKEIHEKPNVRWVADEVEEIGGNNLLRIKGKSGGYEAQYVFDSRIDPSFFQKNDGYTRLLQHFKGWIVRTPEDAFDPARFTMMDFRLKWRDSASFTYVLPLSAREALVEFTLFTGSLIEDEDYDRMLRQYLETHLPSIPYEILEVEKGVIPMSDFPFQKNNTNRLMKIGTAGGWVKPSTGYSFKNCEKFSRRIVENLKAGKAPAHGLFSPRFRLYDSLFLDVLNRRNELGEALFSIMYARNPIQRIFRFLDEESTLWEEFKIIRQFPQRPFLEALFRKIIG